MLRIFIIFIILLSLNTPCWAVERDYVMDQWKVWIIKDSAAKEKLISAYNQKFPSSMLDSCGTVIEIIMGTGHYSYSAGVCRLNHKDGKTEQVRFCGETGVNIYKIEPYHEDHPYQAKELTDLINFFQQQCYI